MSSARDNSHFIMYLPPLMSEVYLLVNLFKKSIHNVSGFFSCSYLSVKAVWPRFAIFDVWIHQCKTLCCLPKRSF